MLDKVLILTALEIHAKRDRISLQPFRPRTVRHLVKATDAFDFLTGLKADVILCDSELADMTGLKFMRLLRQNMNVQRSPVVMVTLENRKDKVLDAISLGCAGYILRPYSQETFERHVKLAQTIEAFNEIEELQLEEARKLTAQGEFDEAIEAYEEILSVQEEAQKFYDMGCQYLLRQKYPKAIISFKKAVKINNLYAEAYKGLADAYRGKGDMESYLAYLQKAAELHAQFDRLEMAKELFIEILKVESQAPNPFNSLGVKLRKLGDIAGALHAYEQALKLTPEDENIHFNMGKAFYFMGEKDKAAGAVAAALKLDAGFTEARKLYVKIVGADWAEPAPTRSSKDETASMVDEG